MSAGKRSSTELVVKFDDGPGGTLRTITGYCLQIGATKITSKMDPATAYGMLVEAMLPTGVSVIEKMKLSGFMDTTPTTGPHAIFKTPDTDPNAGTRTLRIEYGDSICWETECYLESYGVQGNAGNLTKFDVEIQQNSGGWTLV